MESALTLFVQGAWLVRTYNHTNSDACTTRVAIRCTLALLSSVAHDLRTPLVAVKGIVPALRRHDVSWTIAAGRPGHAPGAPRRTSCKTQLFPSGSLKSANEL
jgi:hypothetical protein